MSRKSIENQGYVPTESLDSKSENKKLGKKAKVGMAVAGLLTVGSALAACSPGAEAKGPSPEQTQSQEAQPQPQETDPLSPEVIEATPFDQRTLEQLKNSYSIPADQFSTPEEIADRFIQLDAGYSISGNNKGLSEFVVEQVGIDSTKSLRDYVAVYAQGYNEVYQDSLLFADGAEDKEGVAKYIRIGADNKIDVSSTYQGHSLQYSDDYEIKVNGYETYMLEKEVTGVKTLDESDNGYKLSIEYDIHDNAENLIPTQAEPNPKIVDGFKGRQIVTFEKNEIDGTEYYQVTDVDSFQERENL